MDPGEILDKWIWIISGAPKEGVVHRIRETSESG